MNRKLIIGIVCYPTIGGSGIVATGLGQLLATAGHEVHFISYERPVRLNLPHPNIFFHAVSINEYSLFKYPDYTLPLSVKISEIYEEYSLDILHVHYAVPHATAALLARLMLGPDCRPAIITTLHGTDTNLIGKDPHYRPVIKYSMEHSDGLTTVSESLRQQTMENFQVKQPIRVIHNFCDPAPASIPRLELRNSLGVSENEVLLLHMSNLRPVKRIPDILEAFAKLKNREQARLLILAGGDFGPYCDLVEKLGIKDRLLIRENLWEVADYIEASDIGVYASDQESFGLSILESLAHGKPVVATKVGGIPEVIHHEETGILVPPADPAVMAFAIDRLIESAPLRESIGRAAKNDVQNRFRSDKIRDEYIAYYHEILQA